jgi:hypothetical protein
MPIFVLGSMLAETACTRNGETSSALHHSELPNDRCLDVGHHHQHRFTRSAIKTLLRLLQGFGFTFLTVFWMLV